ncbi:hypothetical protein TCAL_02754 [Tigriopus californicus]|uniref:CID domain-containing protein n=1 Tax=Tigriopus californicus TaxID=6832 RepID=A0A553NQ22_TIGCA|nr:uncharacterized protein LOC131879911 [Tigriopus californicus]TRY67510.1 hypothetical protein TCAL_02754 [Tigriopus californicus]|eukprot:TCALIF_02754-PA protein Name:"Similar to RPRD2 Regulation of nuclear pre-mRNA domain-containing protein 2 (Homo sapiens)" AED:0.01 eAED:0.01 QI:204/1/1/1/1/1/4/157/746
MAATLSPNSGGATGPSDGKRSEKFEEARFLRELVHLKDTQESIQGLSAWCLRNRKSAYKIARCWLKVIQKVKVEQRLPLFYLVNDVVQHAKKRNVSEMLAKFGPVIRESLPHVREAKIAERVIRVLGIWREREIYDLAFMNELLAIMAGHDHDEGGAKSEADQDIVDNFQPTQLCTQLKIMKALEDDTDYKLKTLQESEVNIIDIEPLRERLKDRQHGNDFINDFEDGRKRMEQYIKALDREIGKRRQVVELLQQGKKYYESLLGEADIVATAYTNFGKRLENVRTKLVTEKLVDLEKNQNLTSISPIPSPDYDAPSPQADEMELELPDDDEPPSHIAINEPAEGSHAAESHYQDQGGPPAPPPPSLRHSLGSAGPVGGDLNSRLDSFRNNIQGTSGHMDTNASFSLPSSSTTTLPSAVPLAPSTASSSNASMGSRRASKSSSSNDYSISEFLTKLASGEAVDVDKFTGGSKLTTKPTAALSDPPRHHAPPAPPRMSAGTPGENFWAGYGGHDPMGPSDMEMEPIPDWQLEARDESPPEEAHYNNVALARMAAKKEVNLISLTREESGTNGGALHVGPPSHAPPPPMTKPPPVMAETHAYSQPPPGPPPHRVHHPPSGLQNMNGGQNGSAPPPPAVPSGARPSLQDRLKSLAGVTFDSAAGGKEGGPWNHQAPGAQPTGPPPPRFHPPGSGPRPPPFFDQGNPNRFPLEGKTNNDFRPYAPVPMRGRGGFRGTRPPRAHFHRGGRW